mgnify:CR=1 FL=1
MRIGAQQKTSPTGHKYRSGMHRLAMLGAVLALLSGCNTTGTVDGYKKSEWKRVLLGASWESKHLLTGVLKYKNNGEKGLIEASWPSASLWCEGTWQIESGKYETNNKKPYSERDIAIGTWTIDCNGGSAASGTYESDEIGEFIGIGKDTNGNTVKFEAPITAWAIVEWSKELMKK